MDRLRALFEEMGFENVATFIASGNVIFDAPASDGRALERRIEEGLKEALGYEAATFVRTPAELAAITAYRPFPDEDPNALYVAFLKEAPEAGVQAGVLALRTPTDLFHFHNRELYWFLRTKLSESSLFSGAVLEKTLGAPMTMRNITTVRKLADKYAP
jgi:uncharacterized protein (DUF1697 family)